MGDEERMGRTALVVILLTVLFVATTAYVVWYVAL